MTKPARESWLTLRYWRSDLLASIVVFLVALPLCMGIALASGAPVASGLATGIIGGIVVGLIGGAPLQVAGPAAGLTVICAEVVREMGLPALGAVVLIAGIAQLVAGILRLGQWFRAVSPAVVHGMLSGIGVLILSSQFHVMVDDRPRENGVRNIASLPESFLKGLPLPGLENGSMRRARLELLQRFSQVHELQTEVEHAVERTVTQHGSEELHEAEERALAEMVPAQERVIEAFNEAVAYYQQSPVAETNGQRTDSLVAAIRKAEASLAEARHDLTHDPIETSEPAEMAASNAIGEVVQRLKNHDWAAKVGLLSIVLIIAWQFLARGGLKLIPAPLVAVIAATALAYGLSLPVLYVEVPDNLKDGLTFPAWSILEDVSLKDLIVAGLLMAVVASAETLLCASAVDLMHNGPRTRYDRELSAQGLGNMLCGLVGALPMTGVIVRSAANVQAGGKSRLSAILHGLWIVILVVAAAPMLRSIPTAALAGILVYTGFRLIDFKGFLHLWREQRGEALIFLATVIVIVVEDLLIGVVTGVVLSAAKLLVRFSHLDLALSQSRGLDGKERATLSMSGAATFLRLPKLAAALEEVSAGAELHVDLKQLDYIDHACFELLTNWARQHKASGGRLVIDWESLHARFRTGNGGSTESGLNGETAENADRVKAGV